MWQQYSIVPNICSFVNGWRMDLLKLQNKRGRKKKPVLARENMKTTLMFSINLYTSKQSLHLCSLRISSCQWMYKYLFWFCLYQVRCESIVLIKNNDSVINYVSCQILSEIVVGLYHRKGKVYSHQHLITDMRRREGFSRKLSKFSGTEVVSQPAFGFKLAH